MQSPFTGKEMKLVVRPDTLAIRKEQFQIMHRLWLCEDTGEVFEYNIDETIRQAEDQYRVKHNLPFPEEIKAIREQYGLSAAKMSEVLRLGINQYKQYENGELPSESNANLIYLARDPKDFSQLVQYSAIEESEKNTLIKKSEALIALQNQRIAKAWILEFLMGNALPGLERGFRYPNLEKFGLMVQFFARNMTPLKTQLNKLLFYSDFAHFKQYGRSISGAKYRAISMGPVPDNFDGLFQYLENNRFVDFEHCEYPNGAIGTRFHAGDKEIDHAMLSPVELETLKMVFARFKGVSVQEIIKISHEETGWEKNAPTRAVINYLDSYLLKAV
ncbi:MAG: DUF4065 domain-containing protein [Bacteroidetes bacterium]|nr:DUF4065 domain-containing protein [Bacteroidota bacterium]